MRKLTGLRALFPESSGESRLRVRIDAIDVAAVGLIVAFGVLQVLFVSRANDVLGEDVFYLDAARSMIQHHFYGINGRSETNMPPGLSAIIAVMCFYGACAHVTLQRAMATLQTLGLVANYALFRRVAPRPVAATICLLLASSPVVFETATQALVACFPYFFATSCALLVAQKLETIETTSGRLAWGSLLSLLCVASLMTASTGVALIGALVVRVVWGKRRLGISRGKALLAAALVGVAAQGLWMHRRPAPLEWSIAGYPRPYVQQLMVKSGNNPELGMATASDVIVRIGENALAHSTLLTELIAHHWVDDNWASPAVFSVLLLVVVGWVARVRSTGGAVHDWYFAGYEVIYLLWPWELERRFFLPVAPLACLYLWYGIQTVVALARKRPEVIAVASLLVSTTLALAAWSWTHQGPTHARVQATASLMIWLASGFVAAWILWGRSAPWEWARRLHARLASATLGGGTAPVAVRRGAGALVVATLSFGLFGQFDIARENLDLSSSVNALNPDAEAGLWLKAHTDTNAVVMARQVPAIYHYSGRKIVWLPPTSNAKLLIDGVKRLKVDYIVVVHRQYNYYLPSDDDSFASLAAAFPCNFHPEFENAHVRIFKTHPMMSGNAGP